MKTFKIELVNDNGEVKVFYHKAKFKSDAEIYARNQALNIDCEVLSVEVRRKLKLGKR